MKTQKTTECVSGATAETTIESPFETILELPAGVADNLLTLGYS